MKPDFADLQLLEFARFKLRRPDGQVLKLPVIGEPTLSVMRVKFDFDVFPDVALDEILVDWNFGFKSLAVVDKLLELIVLMRARLRRRTAMIVKLAATGSVEARLR